MHTGAKVGSSFAVMHIGALRADGGREGGYNGGAKI
jgi:hypothetical protein